MCRPRLTSLLLRHVGIVNCSDFKNNDVVIDPNGLKSVPNFTQIHPSVLKLNHADRQTNGHTACPVCDSVAYILQRTQNIERITRFSDTLWQRGTGVVLIWLECAVGASIPLPIHLPHSSSLSCPTAARKSGSHLSRVVSSLFKANAAFRRLFVRQWALYTFQTPNSVGRECVCWRAIV
jgi:hypothetical protein